MSQIKICSVTGHRPGGFPWNYSDKNCSAHVAYLADISDRIERMITKEGYSYFIAGGAIGVDTDFAEAVIRLRDTKYPNIQLEIAVPCENQTLKWTAADKEKYNQILQKANVVNVLSKHYTSFCMQKRNEYMINKSDNVLAYWNPSKNKGGTYNAMRYMERKGIEYELVPLYGFLEEYRSVEEFLKKLSEKAKLDSWEDFIEKCKKK